MEQKWIKKEKESAIQYISSPEPSSVMEPFFRNSQPSSSRFNAMLSKIDKVI